MCFLESAAASLNFGISSMHFMRLSSINKCKVSAVFRPILMLESAFNPTLMLDSALSNLMLQACRPRSWSLDLVQVSMLLLQSLLYPIQSVKLSNLMLDSVLSRLDKAESNVGLDIKTEFHKFWIGYKREGKKKH